MKAREPIKQRCQPGEFYCLSCRAPKRPGSGHGRLSPAHGAARVAERHLSRLADRMIYRAATLANLDQIGGGLEVAFPKAQQRIDDSASALLNADFNEVRET